MVPSASMVSQKSSTFFCARHTPCAFGIALGCEEASHRIVYGFPLRNWLGSRGSLDFGGTRCSSCWAEATGEDPVRMPEERRRRMIDGSTSDIGATSGSLRPHSRNWLSGFYTNFPTQPPKLWKWCFVTGQWPAVMENVCSIPRCMVRGKTLRLGLPGFEPLFWKLSMKLVYFSVPASSSAKCW